MTTNHSAAHSELTATHCTPRTGSRRVSADRAYFYGKSTYPSMNQDVSAGQRLCPHMKIDVAIQAVELDPKPWGRQSCISIRSNDVVRQYTRTRSYADPSSDYPTDLAWSPSFNSKEKLRLGMWDHGPHLCCQAEALVQLAQIGQVIPVGVPRLTTQALLSILSHFCTGLTLFRLPVDRSHRHNPQEGP